MAHFAKLNENNVVTQVIAVDNNELLDNGVELESKGVEFCQSILGGKWIQTSYNAKIRGNYAGIDSIYFPLEDIFVSPKCHEEAILNVKAAKWDCTNKSHEIKEINA
jgi:hypothetical protein